MAINVQGFLKKDIHKFNRSIVWDVFGSKCSSAYLGYNLEYSGRSGGFLYLDDDDVVDGFSIESASDLAVRDLFFVAQKIPSAINLDAAFFVADPRFLIELPDWLLQALPKPPRVALSADELLKYLAE